LIANHFRKSSFANIKSDLVAKFHWLEAAIAVQAFY
jgi:hypothetical protein